MELIGNVSSLSEKVSDIFSNNGYNVEHYEETKVSLAWKIIQTESYYILDAITYMITTTESFREDNLTLSKISNTLINQLANSPNISGVQTKKIFEIKVPHFMGKQVIIVANKLLISNHQNKKDNKFDPTNTVSTTELSYMLQRRESYVSERAEKIFKPKKEEILKKAYTQGKKGLTLTILFIILLIPLTLLSENNIILQIISIADSILTTITATTSLIIHEWRIAAFKKLLRKELAETQKTPNTPPQTTQKIQKQNTKQNTTPKPTTNNNRETPEKLNIEKNIETLLLKEGNTSEFFNQRRNLLWKLAQKAYTEGDRDNCTYHLRGAVTSALKETYIKLTGKTTLQLLPQIIELVCKKTGLNPEEFQQFFNEIRNPQKQSEATFPELFKQAQKLLNYLQSSKPNNTTLKDNFFEREERKNREGLPRREISNNEVSALQTGGRGSTSMKEGGMRTKVNRKRRVGGESEKLIAEAEFPRSGEVVKAEAEVTDFDSVIETLCAEDDIKSEVRRLFDSRGGGVDSVFLVVTRSPEVARVVAGLKRKYPDVPLETYEHIVKGKAQIIVSQDGGISKKIDYDPQKLEKLIIDHRYYVKGLNELR